MMGASEEVTHRRVGAEIARLSREVGRSHGRVFSMAGDGLMVEFASVVDALRCALRLQAEAGRRLGEAGPEKPIVFRMGLNVGEIIVEGERRGGTTVNIAARLEALCEPGGILLSEAVLRQVQAVVPVDYQFAGRQQLKNIRAPVDTFQIGREACVRQPGLALRRKFAAAPEAQTDAKEYRPSLAVLPFRTLPNEPETAHVAEGITEEVIVALSALKELVVVARSSVQEFGRGPLEVQGVGRALDVRYVLHGSVRRTRTGLRFTVELDEAQSGTVVWVDRLDDTMVSPFELQERVTVRVAQSLAPNLRQRELERSARKPPGSLSAYDLTLRALELFYRAEREALDGAAALLQRAVEADPGYAPAHTHLAALHIRMIGQGWSDDPARDSATASYHAKTALERDSNDATALAIYGHVQSFLNRRYQEAAELLDRAMAIGPSCALAWGLSSINRGYLGDYALSVEQAEWAVRLCPMGPDFGRYAHYLAQAYYLAERFAEAAYWGRVSATEAPANVSNLRCLIATLIAAEERDEAQYFASVLMTIVPGFALRGYLERTPLPRSIAEPFVRRLREAGLPE